MVQSETDSIPCRAESECLASAAAERPRCVGPWELVSLEAEGRLAQVYRARPAGAPASQPARYALKLLLPKWQQVPQAVDTIRREALVGRTVRNLHLVSILAASVRQAPYFVVMPWLTGTTLAQKLSARRTFDLAAALWITRQAAEALGALHAAGWMHGDVKPSNLFISPEGHVTLLDLGFARRPEETGSAVDRCVLGTCRYMAPEMITSAIRADIRSDIYSLGTVLFEMLAGRPPFLAENLAELAQQHCQSRPPELRRLAPHLPAGVIRLVREMLAKQPLRRPQDPGELIDRLVPMEIAAFAQRF